MVNFFVCVPLRRSLIGNMFSELEGIIISALCLF